MFGRNGAEKTVSSATEFAVSFRIWNCHCEKVAQPKNTVPRYSLLTSCLPMGGELKGCMSLPGQNLKKYFFWICLFVIIAVVVCPLSLSWLEEKYESLGIGIATWT